MGGNSPACQPGLSETRAHPRALKRACPTFFGFPAATGPTKSGSNSLVSKILCRQNTFLNVNTPMKAIPGASCFQRGNTKSCCTLPSWTVGMWRSLRDRSQRKGATVGGCDSIWAGCVSQHRRTSWVRDSLPQTRKAPRSARGALLDQPAKRGE
jgi:hypothetical protein